MTALEHHRTPSIETRGPEEAYQTRLDAARADHQKALGRDTRLANWRAGVFVVGLAALAAAAVLPAWRGLWLGTPFVLFVALVVIHENVAQSIAALARAVTYYDDGLARLGGGWAGRGSPGTQFEDPDHPYAADLDLFGRGSLFERLCTARTAAGEQTLARWLLHPQSYDRIAAHRGAIGDLKGRVDLRRDLALLGEAVRANVHADVLSRWAGGPGYLPNTLWRYGAGALTAANITTIVCFGTGWLSAAPMLVSIAATIVFKRILAPSVAEVIAGVSEPDMELGIVAQVARRLHAEPFADPYLKMQQQELGADGEPAADSIKRLSRLSSLLDSYRNQMFWPIGFVLLWDIHFAYAIEAWRLSIGSRVESWLNCIGELEALSSLGGFAFENPDMTHAELVEGPPRLEGFDLGHPLLPVQQCVKNDVCLHEHTRVLIVSGSNMSGKSTLLRTVGINAVLALMGAPVRARRLTLSPMNIGATLRVQDSLSKGASRFYAEISRLKNLMDLAAHERSVLFLLDEILHGTNSHDRRIGAQAIVKGLLQRGAIGLVTTHDLALAQSADELGSGAQNVHFEDHLDDGKLAFDYRLKPGVVQKSNAVALMRAVGLEV